MKKNSVTVILVCVAGCIALLGIYAVLNQIRSEKQDHTTTNSLAHTATRRTRQTRVTPSLPSSDQLPPGAEPSEQAGSVSRPASGSVKPVAIPTLPGEAEPAPVGRPSAVTEATAADPATDRPDRPPAPPEMSMPERPPSMLAQINSLVEESQRTAGPEAVQLGEQLLNSTNPVLRVAGMAVLGKNNALTDDVLKRIAQDETLAVPVNSLGWLLDSGYSDSAQGLSTLMQNRSLTTDVLTALIDSGAINSSGSRAALEMISGSLSADDARVLYSSIGQDQTHEYSVRMKATLLIRETSGFETFRNEVNLLQSQATSQDPLWQEGITRLATSIQGPTAVHDGIAAVTANDIDEMLARQYPMSLEDMAQRLEYVVKQPNAFVQQGTSAKLNEKIAELNKLPWTEDQQVSLTRIETVAALLPALEQATTTTPANLPTPPPGSGD